MRQLHNSITSIDSHHVKYWHGMLHISVINFERTKVRLVIAVCILEMPQAM